MADASLIFDTNMNSGGFEKGLGKIESSAKQLIGSLGLALSAGAIAKGMVDLGKKSIALASDLEEVQNVVDVTFGKNADRIGDWSKAAQTAYGMSELSAKQYTGTMGAMLKSMGMTDDAVLTMSTDLVGLAGDFASFYNLTNEDAFAKIRAGISGETEPLKQLGINMSVANLEAYALSQGITTAYSAMTQAEAATLRYNYLLSVSADAQGDFARTADSYANVQRTTALAIENVGTAIGRLLIPAATKATEKIGEFATNTADAINEGGIRGGIEYITDSFPAATAAVAGLAGAYAALLIIKTVQKASAAFAAVQTTLTALEVAGTIAEWADVGALTAKQIIVGVLTGKLTLAAAAQALLNGAMMANPIGLIVAAIGALIAATVLLIKANKEATTEYEKQSQVIDECIQKFDDLNAAEQEAKVAVEEENVAISEQIDRLEELTSKNSLTAFELDSVKKTVSELNEAIPGLNLAYDEVNGTLNKTVGSLRDVAKAQADQKRMAQILKDFDARNAAAADSVNALAVAEGRLETAQNDLANAQKRLNDMTSTSGNQYEAAAAAVTSFQAIANQAQESVDELTTDVAENKAAIAAMEAEYNTLSGAVEEVTAAAEELPAALEPVIIGSRDVAAALEKTGLSADDAAARLDNYSDAAHNMFEQINTESEYTYEQIVANLDHNAQALQQWGADIANLGTKLPSDLLGYLEAEGPEKMAGVVSMLAGESDLSALVAAWESGGDAAVQALLASIGAIDAENVNPATEAAAAIAADTSMEAAAQDAVTRTQVAMDLAVQTADFDTVGTTIANAIINPVSELPDRFKGYGVQTIQGLINGILSKKPDVKLAITDIATSAARSFRLTIQIESPSKLFDLYGVQTMQGYINGVKRMFGDVRSTVSQAAGIAADAGYPTQSLRIREAAYAPGSAAPASKTTNVYQTIYAEKETPSQVLRNTIYLQERAAMLGV